MAYPTLASFPVIGTNNRIYIDEATDSIYLWNGTIYQGVGGGALLSGTINEISFFNSATTIASLPVATYPSLVELAFVKGVTSNLQTQLNLKSNLASPTFTGTPTLPTGSIAITQTAGNSTTALATTAFVTTADALKANLASPTFTGTVSGITSAMVGLGNVDNTNDVNKPISTAQQTALDTKRTFNRVTFSNANATIASTTRQLSSITTLTAARTVTLPAASSLLAGAELLVVDEFGTINGVNNIVIARAGADVINGATSETINAAFGWRRLISNGVDRWNFEAGIARLNGGTFTGATTFNLTPIFSAIPINRMLYTTTGGQITSSSSLVFDGLIFNFGDGSTQNSGSWDFSIQGGRAIHSSTGAGGSGNRLIMCDGSGNAIAHMPTSFGMQWSYGTAAQVVSTGTTIAMAANSSGLQIGGTNFVVGSAVLEANSTTKGFLMPRMTLAQRDAISSPARGLEIYNTTTNRINVHNGVNWPEFLVSSASTLTLRHNGDYIFTGTTATYTLPAINAALLGRENGIYIKNRGSGVLTVNTNGALNTLYTTAAVATLAINAGEGYIFLPDGTFFNTIK